MLPCLLKKLHHSTPKDWSTSFLEDLIARWPGKRCPRGTEHPAVFHMHEVAAVGEILFARAGYSDSVRRALCLLVVLHDPGKLGEPFRAMLRDGSGQGRDRQH
ncbi:HD domain-containing protein [Thalassorhabdomicrobium marinisediminis]|uniref:HD domain-containing protein n=1 Tax=Thalassorhabdomicrobium marinisediminis TaxID=2170577 RepID=UPI003BB0F440